jgi:aminoacrylate hydrolase
VNVSLSGPAGGPCVVLSAGLGGLAAFWRPQAEALEAAGFRVLAFDQRGTGANREPLPEPYSIAHMADDMAAAMDAAGVARAHILGHALGGLVALEFARARPDRALSIIPVNAWAKADRHTERCFELRLRVLETQGAAGYVAWQPLFLHTAPYLSAHAEHVAEEMRRGVAGFQGEATLRARVAALRAFDIRAALPGIAVPALVAASRDDLLVPHTASEALAAALPRAELWLTDFGGHAFTVERPGPFNKRLLGFLRAL